MDDKKQRKYQKDIKKLFTPEILKRNLILASLISTAFEIMKDSLIIQPYSFFGLVEYDKYFNLVKNRNEKMVSEKFLKELKQIQKNLPRKEQGDELKVIMLWFKKNKVLTDEDIKTIIKIRVFRNKITHELLNFLADSDYKVDIKYLFEIKEIVEKVDVWWIMEFTIPTDPQFDNIEIDDRDIESGRVFFLDHFLSIATDLGSTAKKDAKDIAH